MHAADGKRGLDNAQVSAYWNEQFERIRADSSCWINNEIVARHIYRLISRQSDEHWLGWLFNAYFKHINAFERSLSICCGDGSHELAMYQTGKVRFLRGFDISEGAIVQAREKFAQVGAPPDSYLFEVKDANRLDIKDRFDFILSTGALHHVTKLERLIAKVSTMLLPHGYFVLLEFVGPNRFQWTSRQCELINGILAQLDPYYLKDQTRLQLTPPPIAEMLRIDPSEAVRSEDIVPIVRQHFAVEYESHFNGTIMHMLFPLLNAELSNKGYKDFDSLVRLILYFEHIAIRDGLLPSDFTFLVCRPKKPRAFFTQRGAGQLASVLRRLRVIGKPAGHG